MTAMQGCLSALAVILTLSCSGNSGAPATQPADKFAGSFGAAGFVLGPEHGFARGDSDQIRGAALDQSGRMVLAGYSAGQSGRAYALLVRYNPDATLDSSFGGRGYVLFPPENLSEYLGQTAFRARWDAMALDSQDRIVASGQVRTGIGELDMLKYKSLLARFNSDGSLDSTFGTGGVVIGKGAGFGDASFTGYDDSLSHPQDQFVAVSIDWKDRIVTAGIARERYHAWFDKTLIARFTPEGALDTTFGGAGYRSGNAWDGGQWYDDGLRDEFRDLVIQPGGKYVAVGWLANAAWDERTVIARFTEDGRFDPAFNSSRTPGYIIGPKQSRLGQTKEVLYGITLDNDHNIVTAGFVYDPDNNIGTLLERYTPAGELDSSFAGTGYMIHPRGTFSEGGRVDYLVNAKVDSKDRILAYGFTDDDWAGGDTFNRAVMVRYLPDGRVDSSFCSGMQPQPGLFQSVVDGNSVFSQGKNDGFWAVEYLPNGKFYVAGMSDWRVLLARFNEDGTLDK